MYGDVRNIENLYCLQLFHASVVVRHRQKQKLAESDNTLVCKDDEIDRASEHLAMLLHLNPEILLPPDATKSIYLRKGIWN